MYINTWVKDVFFSATIAVLFLLINGFVWNTADQIEPLVLVYKNLDPSLYLGDFYVDSAKDTFTVRYFYVELITFLAKNFLIEYISLFFCFLSLFISCFGLIKISQKITFFQIKGYLVPFFVLFLFLPWTVGGNVVQYNLFIGSSLAKALSILGIYFLIDKKIYLSAILIGIAGLFQVLVGLQLGILLVGTLVIFRKFEVLWKWTLTWLLLISPMLIPIFYRQFFYAEDIEVDRNLFYQLLYSFRNPHHYLPHLFSLGSYIKLLFLVAVGNTFLYFFIERNNFYKILTFNILIAIGLIFYSISIEVWNIHTLGKIQWFKTTIWLSAIGALGIGIGVEYVLKRWSGYKYLGALAICITFVYGYYLHPHHDLLKLDRRSQKAQELEVVHLWIHQHTPKNALFATYIDDEGFLCTAQRPITVGWNAVIHEPWFMVSWYQKIQQQYGVDKSLDNHVEIKQKANQYYETGKWLSSTDAQYCIVRNEVLFENTSVLYATENYKVLKLKE